MTTAWVGITDSDWYEFLRRRTDLDEVNFWQPSAHGFKSLSPGQPFLFKLHYPANVIVGGGFFAAYSELPISLAWDAFGPKNGVESLESMRLRVAKYRRQDDDPRDDYHVGCIVLVEPFFWERGAGIPSPADFSKNIVVGKRYDLQAEPGISLWREVSERRAARGVVSGPSPMFGDPTLVRPRLGQGAFRVMVTEAYGRRCAVTGEKALPVLQAAHIMPVSRAGVHQVSNGLLLRSDVHTLFDHGYVTITPDYRFKVSHRLREEFHNGEHYFRLNGHKIHVPSPGEYHPSRELLDWHMQSLFKGD